jgi:hypothetical protein
MSHQDHPHLPHDPLETLTFNNGLHIRGHENVDLAGNTLTGRSILPLLAWFLLRTLSLGRPVRSPNLSRLRVGAIPVSIRMTVILRRLVVLADVLKQILSDAGSVINDLLNGYRW